MAIDTQQKRISAIATRRLPWMRRFAPVPDGTVTQADRQQVAFVYVGIAAAEPEAVAYSVATVLLRNDAPATLSLRNSAPATLSLEQ